MRTPTQLGVMMSISETGFRPLDVMFGSSDGPYLQLPQGTLPAEITVQWIKMLDANLKQIRDKSSVYQNELINSRVSKTPI